MTTRTVGPHAVELSNLDKVLFPDDGITKGDLIDYYVEVADVLLPHARKRPVTLHRFPDGIEGKRFYQRDVAGDVPGWVTQVRVEKEDGHVTCAVIDNAATLAVLANLACITPHLWLSRRDKLNHPDLMIFDLDPPRGDFGVVKDAARAIRDVLAELGLAAYVKTTGSRGLHIATPLARGADFDTVRAFARDLAGLLVARDPKRLTVEPRKEKRRGRLFLDTARNAYSQSAAAPYAVRARPGAPVATPVEWEELADRGFHAQRYTMKNVFRRLSQREDAWAGMFRHARSLSEPRRRLERLLEEDIGRTREPRKRTRAGRS